MDMKDLLGFGKPITKLIEVVSSATGRVTRSYFTKKDADATAYKIRILADALHDSKKLLGDAAYAEDGLTLTAAHQPEVLPAPPQLEERALARASFQESKKQLNVESVVQHAAEELLDKETVSDEKVDEDWVSRFFSIAENISSEEMQTLWGKILAGEVRQPNTYSLRTLDTLKNLTKKDAEVFAKVAQAALVGGKTAFTLRFIQHEKIFEEQFSIKVGDILLLKELGLMAVPDLSFRILAQPMERTETLIYGNNLIVLEIKPSERNLLIDAEIYTEVGKELLSLVEITPNIKYVEEFAKTIPKETAQVLLANITSQTETMIHYEGLHEILPTDAI